jgi:hypothetical protein
MKKLDDIPKKNVFDVPEGYFEKLPNVIQSRVAGEQNVSTRMSWTSGLRLAIPVLIILVIAGIFWFNKSVEGTSAESILASVQTTALISYLNETDISTDELLDDVALDSDDVSKIEESVYQFELNDEDLEELFNDIDR